MSNIIDKIQLSGVTYTIGGGGGGTGGTAVEEMTQAQYDAAATAGTLDDETLYIITDAEEINANEYVTKAQNNFSGYTEIKSMEGSYNYLHTNRTDIRTFYLSGTSSNDGVVGLCIHNLACEVQIGGFDFSTAPTNEYVDITYDSTNKIYTISIKSTYANSYIEYGYYYNVENSKIWFINTEISSGQSAAVLNQVVPDVYDEIDKKPSKSNTVKTDTLSVSKSNSTQWYLYYGDNADNGHSTSFDICDNDGIVMAGSTTKLSLKEISTVNAYAKEWITNDCKYNICGNENITYNDAAKSIVATFNSSLAEYNQFYFVVYYNSQGSNSLAWYITKKEGTIYMSGAYLSDETSDFSTLNSEISANTGLNIEFSQNGLTYTKGTSNDPYICYLFCNYCLQTNDSTSLFSSAITTQNKIGMYGAVNTLFGQYETGSTGGGKAIEAGRGISVTTGETADTVSFNLPISAGTGNNSILMSEGSIASGSKSMAGGQGCQATREGAIALGQMSDATANWAVAIGNLCLASGKYSTAFGDTNKCYGEGNFVEGCNNKAGQDILNNQRGTHAEGYYTEARGEGSHTEGRYTKTLNNGEHASGSYNVSNTGSTDADKTLFSVGNGTADNARHNAFEIRQNGDIYYFDGTNDVKLQDKFSSIDTTIGDINTILQSI